MPDYITEQAAIALRCKRDPIGVADEVQQLRADKRELVESLLAMTVEYRQETTGKFFQAPLWLKHAEALIQKHGDQQ